jgi:hypothetical protein
MMYDWGSGQHQGAVGMRFPNLQVPAGATIRHAWVQFTIDEANGEATGLTWRAEASDDAATYGTSTFGISTRPRTLASVLWEPSEWCCPGQTRQSADLAPIVQEVVGRAGWNSGHALALIVTGDGERVAQSYDKSPAVAPLLHVEYVPVEGLAGARDRSRAAFEARVSPQPIVGRGALQLVIPRTTVVRAELFDVRGRRVRTLMDAPQLAAGRYEVALAPGLASGVYFYRVTCGNEQASGRCILLR